MDQFTLWAVSISGEHFELHCPKNTTVQCLKQDIGKVAGLYWPGLRLFDGVEELKNEWTVDGERIKQDAHITFVFDDDQPPPLTGSSSSEAPLPHEPLDGDFDSYSDSET